MAPSAAGKPVKPSLGLVGHRLLTLAGQEATLARAELRAQARQYSVGGIGLAMAAALAAVAGIALLAAGGLGLALVVPGWAAALIMFAVLGLLSGAVAGFAFHRLAGAGRPLPRTTDSVRRDLEMIRSWPAAADHSKSP